METTSLPIFFFHKGSQKGLFFDKILRQAEISNGRENIYILTDNLSDTLKHYNCIDIRKYADATTNFDKVYQHHSKNKYAFEKACFDRWFIINVVAKELNFENFFHADCDVLISEDLKPVFDKYIKDKFDGSMMYFEDGLGSSITSGHSSFWNRKLIDEFCKFTLSVYNDPKSLNQILRDTLEGKFYDNTNLSDMILLDVFRTKTKPATLNLFTLESENICFDFNVNVSYNGFKNSYKLSKAFKIKKIDQVDYALCGEVVDSEDNGKPYKFYTLHFQGYITKTLIPLYIRSADISEDLFNKKAAYTQYFLKNMTLTKNRFKGFLKRSFTTKQD